MQDAAPYFAYFGERAGEPGAGYYSYDAGAWRTRPLDTPGYDRDVSTASIAAAASRCIVGVTWL